MDPGGIEGLGDALTGGVVARQFEPEAGEAQEEGHHGACLNCKTPLTGPYCHQCGQAAHVHRSLAAFWHDLAHGVLHFEGKIWRTLPLLAWRPGQLTRRYIEGERARFVSPIALFLFSVFLMFGVFNFVHGPNFFGNGKNGIHIELTQEQKVQWIQTERAKAVEAGRSTASLDLAMAAIRQQAADQAELKNKVESDTGLGEGDGSDDGWFQRAYRHAKENPELLAYKLQTNGYKFSWMLIPISVPFVWLMFLHRRRYRRYKAYDHTVFVTYSLSFMTLLIVTVVLLRSLYFPRPVAALAVLFIPPIHIFQQLKGAYDLSWFGALWRTFALAFVGCIISFTIFMLLLLALGVMH